MQMRFICALIVLAAFKRLYKPHVYPSIHLAVRLSVPKIYQQVQIEQRCGYMLVH